MMTSSNGNIFRVTGHLWGNSPVPGEFPAQRPVTRGVDVFLDPRLNKRLRKQWRGWWFETLSRSLWRHCTVQLLSVPALNEPLIVNLRTQTSDMPSLRSVEHDMKPSSQIFLMLYPTCPEHFMKIHLPSVMLETRSDSEDRKKFCIKGVKHNTPRICHIICFVVS